MGKYCKECLCAVSDLLTVAKESRYLMLTLI